MKFCLYTNTISPHQLPLARELINRLGAEDYRYIYTDVQSKERINLGWEVLNESWIVRYGNPEAEKWLRDADVVMMQHPRDWGLFEDRLSRGKMCLYASERWFKPSLGFWRLAHPGYFRMARRFVEKIMSSPHFIFLPDGIHSARDMARLCGLMHGDLRCLFRAPELEFERRPGGRIFNRVESVETNRERVGYCLDKMRMWGYFVEECKVENVKCKVVNSQLTTHNSQLTTLKILWGGRFLNWKRVDTIIRAVGEISARSTRSTRLKITLDLYGAGPDEKRLKKLAAKYGDAVKFHPPVPIAEVRKLMHEHDVYVISSNACEGWGAVVNEALEEGMKVIGTYEAGSSVTILPDSCLFHAGDWRGLARLLCKADGIEHKQFEWSASKAADMLISICGEVDAHCALRRNGRSSGADKEV